MRRGELCGLRWRDLDLEAGQVTVNQRVSDLAEPDDDPARHKSKKKRRLALDPVTVTILAEQHVRASERCEGLGVELTPEAYVWSQDADHRAPWRPHPVTDAFRAVSGPRGSAPSACRRPPPLQRHADAWRRRRPQDAGWLGHDASVLLRIYGHVIPATDREAAEILGALMRGDADAAGASAG